MKITLTTSLAMAGMLAASAPAFAHHAFAAEFDSNKPVKLRGTVAKVELINPHSWIHVDVKNADGTTARWMVEGGSPNALFRRGVTQKSLALGTEVLVDGYQAKDGGNKANGRDITLANGPKLFLGSSGTGAPYEESNAKEVGK